MAATSLLNLKRFLRSNPLDLASSEERSFERIKRVFITALSSVFAKFISVISSFITIPLALKYLGTELYGLWMTITSVIVMLNFADFGIGNGVLNLVTTAYGKND